MRGLRARWFVAWAGVLGVVGTGLRAGEEMGAMTMRESGVEAGPRVVEVSEVGRAWAGHEVAFALLTRGDAQYVGYYDEHRDMTIAVRRRGRDGAGGGEGEAGRAGEMKPAREVEGWGTWTRQVLTAPSPVFGEKGTSTRTGWDSHNYIALGVDRAGHLHVVGNLHGHPLLYFRTTRAGDVSSLERLDFMTGDREAEATYPRFFDSPTGELVFSYRDGYSGNGADLYNIYDVESKRWRRLLDTPLTDGRTPDSKGRTAYAYMRGPTLGPDGYYHAVWVWRDHYHCETNRDLSYARSKDLVHWETSAGKLMTLPMTSDTCEVVDPVPIRGGMINNNTLIGFDAEKRVVLTYHKFDADGFTQVYNARSYGKGGWQIVPATRWNYRWWFEGGGSMLFQVRLSPVEVAPDGRLRLTWWNARDGEGGGYLDPFSLAPVEPYTPVSEVPVELAKCESPDPRMLVRWARDQGDKQPHGLRYVLRWETLPTNNDLAPEGPIPAPCVLRVYGIGV
jgi:hypothetical protein